MRRQRGVALLAVSLLLVVLGALAFLMARQSAMAGNAVNAQYDTEAARYLAEAGVNVARWRDQQLGCGGASGQLKAGRIDASGTFSATVTDRVKTLDINAVGATDAGGARVSMTRQNLVAHNNAALQLDIASDKMIDTTITADAPTAVKSGAQYLELTQARSSVLMQFTLPAELTQAIIVKADLALTQYQTNSVLPAQVSAHRLTRGWDARFATWLWWTTVQPWSNPGADYTAGNVAIPTTIAVNATYSWDITALVDGWANNDFPNYGVLLLADGPAQQAQFFSLENAQNKPRLHITYYPAC